MGIKFGSMKDVSDAVYNELFANKDSNPAFPGEAGQDAAMVLNFSGSTMGGVFGGFVKFYRALATFADVQEQQSEGYENDDPTATRMVTLCVLAQDALLMNAGIRTLPDDARLQEHLRGCESRWNKTAL